jgi:hypothetical protein
MPTPFRSSLVAEPVAVDSTALKIDALTAFAVAASAAENVPEETVAPETEREELL